MFTSKSDFMRILAIALATTGSLVVLSSATFAGPRDHDGGFFLRLSGGVGYAETKLEEGGASLKMSGTGADMNFAIGAMISKNLALHGTLFGWSLSDPELEAKVDTVLGKGNISGDLFMGAIGGGLTYYIMPANVYLSGSIGAGSLELEGADSGTGVVFDATIGKEWWVGNSWGLGVAGAFGYHSIPDGDLDLNWSGPSFGLRFSATMN